MKVVLRRSYMLNLLTASIDTLLSHQSDFLSLICNTVFWV